MIDPELLDILACPACRAPCRDEGASIVCTACGLMYPVRDGLPILLVDEAQRPGEASKFPASGPADGANTVPGPGRS